MKRIIVLPLLLAPLAALSGCNNNNGFTIVWVDENGNVLETDYNVKSGEIPTYDGGEGAISFDGANICYIDGWDKEVVPANGNATYAAKYRRESIYQFEEYHKGGYLVSGFVSEIDPIAYKDNGLLKDLKIPAKHDGLDVAGISTAAFKENLEIDFIDLSDCPTVFGMAFSSCRNLSSVLLGKNTKEISDYAFQSCFSLVEVINQSDLNVVAGENTNGYVSRFALNVIKSRDESKIEYDGKDLYCKFNNRQIYVNHIGDDESISIKDGTYGIHANAFNSKEKVKTVSLPSSLVDLGNGCFAEMASLEEITIPSGVSFIPNDCFKDSNNLARINIEYPEFTFGDNAFNATAIRNFKISSKQTMLPDGCFAFCKNLEWITLPTSITSIGMMPLYNTSAKVYYEGNETQYEAITKNFLASISEDQVYYYSESYNVGNYWHYVNGEPVIW